MFGCQSLALNCLQSFAFYADGGSDLIFFFRSYFYNYGSQIIWNFHIDHLSLPKKFNLVDYAGGKASMAFFNELEFISP